MLARQARAMIAEQILQALEQECAAGDSGCSRGRRAENAAHAAAEQTGALRGEMRRSRRISGWRSSRCCRHGAVLSLRIGRARCVTSAVVSEAACAVAPRIGRTEK